MSYGQSNYINYENSPEKPKTNNDRSPFPLDTLILVFSIIMGVIITIITHLAEAPIRKLEKIDNDPVLTRALSMLVWALWIHSIAAIGLIIFSLLIIFLLDNIEDTLIIIVNLIVAATYISSSILMYAAAREIGQTVIRKTGNREAVRAHQLCLMAAVISIINSIILIVWTFIVIYKIRQGSEVNKPFQVVFAKEVKRYL